jgi:hypothetical protein
MKTSFLLNFPLAVLCMTGCASHPVGPSQVSKEIDLYSAHYTDIKSSKDDVSEHARYADAVLSDIELWNDINDAYTPSDKAALKKRMLSKGADSFVILKDLKSSDENRQRIHERLDGALTKLSTLLPIDTPIDVYFVQCISCFNGKEFLNKGVPAVAINVAYPDFGSDREVDILIAHEASHALHLRHLSPEEQKQALETAVGSLYREGLATYLTRQLYSESPEKLLMMTSENYDQCEKDMKSLRGRFIAEAFADQTVVNSHFFRGKSTDGLPPRCGYAIGYEVVKEIGKTHKPRELLEANYETYSKWVTEILNK